MKIPTLQGFYKKIQEMNYVTPILHILHQAYRISWNIISFSLLIILETQ